MGKRKKQEANRSNKINQPMSYLYVPFFFLYLIFCYPYLRLSYPRVAQLKKTKLSYGGSCEVTLPPFFRAPHFRAANFNPLPLLFFTSIIHYIMQKKLKSQHKEEMLPSVSVSFLSLLSSFSSPPLSPLSLTHRDTRLSGWVASKAVQLPDQFGYVVVVAPSVVVPMVLV